MDHNFLVILPNSRALTCLCLLATLVPVLSMELDLVIVDTWQQWQLVAQSNINKKKKIFIVLLQIMLLLCHYS